MIAKNFPPGFTPLLVSLFVLFCFFFSGTEIGLILCNILPVFLRLSSKHMMVLSLSWSQQLTISEMQARVALKAKEVIRLSDGHFI